MPATGPATKRTDVPPRPQQVRAIADWAKAERGVTLLGALGFENADAFAMKSDVAREKGIASLVDLSRAAGGLRLGSDLEFLDRPEWAAVRRAYDLRFAGATPYSPTFMYRALESGRADVISAFSSDGLIAADRLTVLSDPRRAIPGYDAILLLSPRAAKDAGRVVVFLRPVIGRVSVDAMREANYMVDRDDAKKATPEAVVGWLAAKVGLSATGTTRK
ncbi:glycine betaine ABC transporter substrate-binding protein [Sphingomonas sp. MMS24-JH45]